MMTRPNRANIMIKHVAIIGGGIMGGNIAGFFANIGITCDLYDLDMNVLQHTMIKLTDRKAKVPMLYTPRFAERIRIHHSQEMSGHLARADMVIEVVPEKMAIKQSVLEQIDRHCRSGAIIATNTSGLSITKMAEFLSPENSAHFVGTHYFNPVRFLPLVEIIPGAKTLPEVVALLQQFFYRAGKKPIVCRDTTNFVANRVGVFAMMKTLHLMDKYGFDVETIDAITGPPIGNPKSAVLRLSDMVGLDTIEHVSLNVYHSCPDDECRDVFQPPAWMRRMIADNRHGDKTGKGFYQKTFDRQILALDLKTGQYRPLNPPRLPEVQASKKCHGASERVKLMCSGDSPVNEFCRELVLSTAAYSLQRVGEIADDILTIDNALKWGFNREIGPIESVDAIGWKQAAADMQRLGIEVPDLLEQIGAHSGSVYQRDNDTIIAGYDPATQKMQGIPIPAKTIFLTRLGQDKIVAANPGASMVDLGDDVLLFQPANQKVPTMNPVDDLMLSLLSELPTLVKKKGFRAVVIGNQSANFCAGAQLQMILELCQAGQWAQVEQISSRFQQANMALYHADFPVVVAPHGMTLGGGMEITLAGSKRVALAEFYGGLVEVGVGLLPGGAGNLLLLLQFIDAMAANNPDPMVPVNKSFELIAYGMVSSSAYDAIEKGLLCHDDVIVVSKDEQLYHAKQTAMAMSESYRPKQQRQLYLPGPDGYQAFEINIDNMVVVGKLTQHSAVIAKKQAYVLTGGSAASPMNPIGEQQLLDLERQAFVELCREAKSQERIAYMLKNKKPLIN